MKAVVTGGAGFIGSTLVDRLLADGHDVVVLDDLSTGNEENLAAARSTAGDRLRLEVVDLREDRSIELIAAAGADVVFHLAAQADVRASVDDPIADAQANVLGTIRVLEGARRAGTRKVVLASSGGTLYGDADPSLLPLDESTPHRPESPYGASKLAAGAYLRVYGSLYGIRWTELALANVYGPRQDADGEAGVVAIFTGRLLAGEPCTVYGSGEQTRDFVYVGDVVDAFVAAADRGDGQLFNIGAGVETSVNGLYRSMASAVGGPDEPIRAPARTGELQRSALDASLAAADLDWHADIDLDEGIRRTIDWFRTGS
ncbi:MAG: NAD-dependent epimerase/dehydratase family protein [Actinobacteria bacterium]|nr:NAD-dependent epimerase/dehydratase family protein [Actinomycetota bacterium]